MPVFSASSAFADPLTPQQQLTALQGNLAAYTAQYNQYQLHYQTYAPALISQLTPASDALTAFTADVSILTNAVSTLNQDTADLATAQSNLANQPTVISTTAVSLDVARAAYETAATAYNAIHPSYTTALAERNTAYADYQATAQGGTITETFTNRVKNTTAQFLVNGTTPLSTSDNSGYSITNNEYAGTYMSGGSIKAYQPYGSLVIIPPNQTATTFFQFATGALNGDFNAVVTYTDGSTGALSVPNGVFFPAIDEHTRTQAITAPSGKYIQSITLPAHNDWYYMDNFVFTSQVFNATLYQTYLDKQAALDSILTTYTPAAATYNAAVATLSLAESTYNTARDASTTAALEALVTSEQAAYDAALLATQTAITNALASKEVIAAALAAVVLPPDSLEVTSTSDEYVEGTLRWALTQANAVSGSIYDRIKIKTDGTITLTSNLPAIASSVTILGPTNQVLRIDGANTYSAFFVSNASTTLNISDLTIKNTKRADWQQGSGVFVARGTANITRVSFEDVATGSAVSTKEGSSYINITASSFKRIAQYGVFSNYGGTPSTTTEADTQYDNRITISNTLFESNGAGIHGERTVVVDSSTFKNNQYGFRMQGINKHRVTNSTFEGNQIGVYTSSWIPTTWTTFFNYPSRVITGNTFKTGTNTPIFIDDRMNDGKSTALTALITGNTWDESTAAFVNYKHYDTTLVSNQTYLLGMETPTTTPPFSYTIPTSIKPVITAPTNVAATSNQDGSVTLTWEPSTATNTTVERYAVSWTTEGANGWGVASTTTSITLPREVFSTTGGLGKTYIFTVRADNDTVAVYSPTSAAVTAEVAAPPAPVIPPAPVVPPVVIPTPEPTIEPTPEPTPTEEPTQEPTPEPTKEPVVEPTKEPEEPAKPEEEEKEVIKAEDLPEIISAELLSKIDLTELVATDLTEAQAEALVEAAMETFETAEKGSDAYEQALDALYVAAAADDIVISPELAAIPGAAALVDAINFMSNVGADMSPAVREESEKIVVSAVVAGQVAQMAMSASVVINAGTPPTPSAPSAPTGGGSSPSAPSRKQD